MVVPAGWKELEISELCVPQKSRIDPRVSGGGDICVELEHIAGGSGQLLGVTNTSGTSSLKTKFEPGDVLFGKLRAYLRKYWLAEFAGVCSTEIWALSANRTEAVPGFLAQIVRTEDFIEAASLSYGTHMPRSDWAIVSKLIVSVPPLKEQEAIAEALSDADSAIESLDAWIAKKRDVKQATMQQLLTGRTRLPGFTAEWKEVRLGDLLGYEQPTKYLVSSSDYVEGGQVPVLTAGKSFLLGYTDDNDGIYTNLPTIIFDDFTTATQWVDFEFKVKSSACKMLRPKNGACNPRYVFERLRALNYQTSDHKRHWISVFHSMEMMMPPLKEQEAIAEVLTVMDDELKALTEQVSKLRMVKEGMMQDLLTGKVRLV